MNKWSNGLLIIMGAREILTVLVLSK